jgi:hypothetical protein
MAGIIQRLRGKAPKQTPPQVGSWLARFNAPKPRLLALLGSGASGSHFVLHKLHGHPSILALEEHILYPELKSYFNSQTYSIEELAAHQLLPAKKHLREIRYIALNKPTITSVTYHFPFERSNLLLLYLVRNPIAFYLSWERGWDEMAQRDYKMTEASRAEILAWLDRQFLFELSNFAIWAEAKLDLPINLESFVAQTQENLSFLFSYLSLDAISLENLASLTHCPACGTPLEVKPANGEPTLHCPSCNKFFLAAGGYNYIRVPKKADLANWKQHPRSTELFAHFSGLLGREFLAFFENESYLNPDGHLLFQQLYTDLAHRYNKDIKPY